MIPVMPRLFLMRAVRAGVSSMTLRTSGLQATPPLMYTRFCPLDNVRRYQSTEVRLHLGRSAALSIQEIIGKIGRSPRRKFAFALEFKLLFLQLPAHSLPALIIHLDL